MTTTAEIPSTATPRGTLRPVPRWAERVAHAIPLVALPVCLWRLPIAFGFTMGADLGEPTWGRVASACYIFGLSVLSEAFALLCFGLVRPWGEVVPGWVPVLRGRRVPPFAVIVPALLGVLVFTALLFDWVVTTFQIGGHATAGFSNDWWRVLAATVSGLFLAWGPLLLALTYGYYRRRCRPAGRP
ncbi:hypothetical protein [Streptomyces sp. ISL-11]|uniref:hypothetical protein n=1 Tax=Streptomyces sp. ISL-11 TaxID=2819174 RepID=UPI001BE68E7B|nr:hypothetical protein [Streptomyces sp. ISL-11]MBT2384929.1 hypothetical protein [Streptomyces sp. ISL-11]